MGTQTKLKDKSPTALWPVVLKKKDKLKKNILSQHKTTNVNVSMVLLAINPSTDVVYRKFKLFPNKP